MRTTSRREIVTCLDNGPTHAWKNLGLDVVDGELRSVKRCVWCETERTSKPKPHPERSYFRPRSPRS